MRIVKMSTRESYDENGVRSIKPIECTAIISEVQGEKPKRLIKEDVWGNPCGDKSNLGMIVARQKETCPIWKDKLEYKSTTFICPINKEDEVIYWIEYVYGCDSISRRKQLDDLRVALRADYQCW